MDIIVLTGIGHMLSMTHQALLLIVLGPSHFRFCVS